MGSSPPSNSRMNHGLESPIWGGQSVEEIEGKKNNSNKNLYMGGQTMGELRRGDLPLPIPGEKVVEGLNMLPLEEAPRESINPLECNNNNQGHSQTLQWEDSACMPGPWMVTHSPPQQHHSEKQPTNPTPGPPPQTHKEFQLKMSSFIIQKYVEQPLLINKRKFDIRIWVLITHNLDCYMFREGYLRTSCKEYLIELDDIDNIFVHLTNNAVQKFADNYGQFEDGNQLSFDDFQRYIDKHYSESGVTVRDHLVPEMHNIIKKTLFSVRKKLNLENKKYCFELFGYDFLIDVDFNLWLIEINTNPCLEESSRLLKQILPRLMDDSLKLTTDVLFPKIKTGKQLGKKKDKINSSPYAQAPYPTVSGNTHLHHIGLKSADKDKDKDNSYPKLIETPKKGDKVDKVGGDTVLQEIKEFDDSTMKTPSRPSTSKKSKHKKKAVHPIDGYPDNLNLW